MDLAARIQSVSSRNFRIYTALWGFVFGVLVASLVRIPPLVCLLIIAVALVSYFAEKHTLILIALCVFALGALRFDIKDFHILQTMGNTGVVLSEPERRDFDTRFVFESDNGERAIVSTDYLSGIAYGDRVEVNADFTVPGVIADESGREFNYAAYLSKDDIYYTASRAEVKSLDGDLGGSRLISILLSVKGKFVESIRSILPEPESSLFAGLVLAGKQALPKDILEEFRNAGVVHIVVLSGYNVTIIAEFFLMLFAFLGTRRAAAASAIAIVLFTLMTGASATVVRASIMVLMLLLGRIIGRQGSSGRILLFTAVLMLIHNPKELVFDPSFHLSFLAMLALIYVAPILNQKILPLFEKFPKTIELISVTLATQIVVVPYLLYNMGNFSIVFLLSNLLILLIVPYTMLIGFAATVVGFVSSVLAWPLAFIAHLLLKWILLVAGFFGNLSFASVQIDGFPLWLTILTYVALMILLFSNKENARPNLAFLRMMYRCCTGFPGAGRDPHACGRRRTKRQGRGI